MDAYYNKFWKLSICLKTEKDNWEVYNSQECRFTACDCVGWKVASIKTGHYNHIAKTAHALKFNPELSNCTAKTINYTLTPQYFRFNLEIIIWYQWSTGIRGKVVAKRISAWLLNFFKNGVIHTTVTP